MRKSISEMVTFIEMRWNIVNFFEWLSSGIDGWTFAAGFRVLPLRLTFDVTDLLDD